ncbi:hypothetical protein FHG87_002757 [Trinorchestia longiramus]|nr:hypothetical protein FHG87_002757 [Trinorchestia longiramus]
MSAMQDTCCAGYEKQPRENPKRGAVQSRQRAQQPHSLCAGTSSPVCSVTRATKLLNKTCIIFIPGVEFRVTTSDKIFFNREPEVPRYGRNSPFLEQQRNDKLLDLKVINAKPFGYSHARQLFVNILVKFTGFHRAQICPI